MSDPTDHLDQIEARAEAATEGPWEAWDRGIGFEVHVNGESLNSEFRETFRQADAEFIAAARTDVPALVAALRAVLDLHRPGSYSATMHGWTACPVCPTCHDKAGVHPCGCWRDVDEDHDCLGCSRPGNGAYTQWPCLDVRAIADALGVEP